jgi:hypothetical protein
VVKLYLTGRQVLRLLCIGGRCNLFIVRSIQSTENAYDEPILSYRPRRAGAAGGYRYGCFGTRFPVVEDDVRSREVTNVEGADVGFWLPHSAALLWSESRSDGY